jgi:hypothetical protein
MTELRKSKSIGDAILLEWLEQFQKSGALKQKGQ